MLNQILANTPRWVWVLLVALLWLGLSQAVTRTASLKRITLMPLAMIGLSLYGTVAAFGAEPQVLLVWLCAGGLMAALVLQQPLQDATHFDTWKRRFTLPGSWVPLMLILGIFMTRYIVGAVTAMQPALAHDASFSLAFGALYGAFSGVFLARAARLWRLALQADRPGTPAARRTNAGWV
ncbi:MAG: hypothetical protein IV109_10400 [Rhodoferax sp.]|nr:DUF6622 family protein [Rhodoferax sp.]MBT9507000.1 hypothetical protein [Rhodoferax sp.]